MAQPISNQLKTSGSYANKPLDERCSVNRYYANDDDAQNGIRSIEAMSGAYVGLHVYVTDLEKNNTDKRGEYVITKLTQYGDVDMTGVKTLNEFVGEQDPQVYEWAKQPTKPSYNASEVGAVPDTRKVNNKSLSSDIQLTPSDIGAQPTIDSSHKLSADNIANGSTNKVVTQAEKNAWDGKQNALTQEQLTNITKGGTALQPVQTATGLLKDDGAVDTETQSKAANAIPMPSNPSSDKVLGYENGAVAWVDKPQDGEKGDKGDKGEDAINPFKGYYPSGVSLPDTGAVGDYLYAPPSDPQSTATATIWHYDANQTPPWTDTEIDVSAVVALEFGSGQSVASTKIKDENGDEVSGNADVLSAEAGKEINNKIEGEFTYDSVTYDNTDFTYGYLYSRAGVLMVIPTGFSAIRKAIPADVESIEAVGLFNYEYYYGAFFLSSSSANSFISGLPRYSGGNRNFYHKIEKSDIPANAAYIVIVAEHSAYVTWSDVYAKINTKSLVSEGIKQEMEILEGRVDDSLNDISDLVQVKKSYTYYTGVGEDFEQLFFPVNKGDVIRVNSTREFSYGGVLRVKNNGAIVQTKMEYFRFVNYELDIIADGDLYFYCSSSNQYTSTVMIEILKYATQDEKNISDYVDNLSCLNSDIKEIGGRAMYPPAKTEVGEQIATSNYNNSERGYIVTVDSEFNPHEDYNKNIIVINHDDLQKNDWLATRKLYEKYGMMANFSMIVNPFSTVEEKEERISNIKKLIKGGNKIGLHSILGISWWFYNPLFDVRPDGSSTFAPTLSEIRGSNADGTGTNTFGNTITATTTVNDLLIFVNPPSSIGSTKVIELTEDQYKTLIQHYTWLGNTQTLSGLDLNDNSITNKKLLWWLEYWNTCLYGSNYGFSNNGDISAKFLNDYDVPSGASASDYYPEAKQLLEGKVVYYGDTTNPHFSEAMVKTDPNFNNNSYQLVGKFNKGLFKGCFSSCNYEVIYRIVLIATSYLRHYYGLYNFNDYNGHGIGYVNCHWVDNTTGFRYNERTKTKLDSISEQLYFSYFNGFSTPADMLKANGINNRHQQSPSNAILEGETGLWFGQKGCIKDCYALEVQAGDVVDYLCVATTSSSEPSGGLLSWGNLNTFLGEIKNRTKYFFENAGTTKTRNGITLYIPDDLQKIMRNIIRTLGTGRVPIISLDTINNNANNSMGVDLLLRFCKELGLRVVDIETARQLCTSFKRDFQNNWFPNPKFNQSLLAYLGDSNNNLIYTPDSFYGSNSTTFNVSTETIEGKQEKVLSCSGGNATTAIFGLTPGKYKLSYYAKSDSGLNTSKVNFYLKPNSQYCSSVFGDITRYIPNDAYTPTTTFTLHEYEFEIPEFERVLIGDSAVHKLCCGYENNIGKIVFSIVAPDEAIQIYNPEIKVI